jgi:hypothetical protein
MENPILLPYNIKRCPYCYTPIRDAETESHFTPELISFYNSIGIFFWNKDPLHTCNGTKYKWYEKEYPDEYFYKNKRYVIYDELPEVSTANPNPPNPRKDIGLHQISINDVRAIQDSRKFLETYMGVPAEVQTEFSDLHTLDEGSSFNQNKKKYTKELQESTYKLATYLGIDIGYFNFLENGKFIVRKNRAQDETIQTEWMMGDISAWDGHIRNTHIEDLRHNLIGIWNEQWEETSVSLQENFFGANKSPDPHIYTIEETALRFWKTEQVLQADNYGAGTGFSTVNTSITISPSGLEAHVLSSSSHSGTDEINFHGTQKSSGYTGIGSNLDSVLAINRKTKIVIKNFTQSLPEHHESLPNFGWWGFSYGVDSARIIISSRKGNGILPPSLPTLTIYAIGSEHEQNPYVTQDGNDLIVNFESLVTYWGGYIEVIGIHLASVNTWAGTLYGAGSGSGSIEVTVTLGNIFIYPTSFRIKPYYPYNLPTGYEDRIVDPLPE